MQALIDQWEGLTSWGFRLAGDIGDAFSGALVLFVLGLVLLALVGERMERVEGEVAARPARSFALGLLGMIGAAVIGIALCVMVIGIPFAIVGAMGLAVLTYAGVVAVLRTLGAALIQHRTPNRYLHLALGCLLFFVVGCIPWLGKYATFAVLATGLGAVLGSRIAGLWRPRNGGGSYAAV
ncbi:MAG: hypothetical protein IT375_11345 [Polyangiaceae bacterium]|nr:hypothetical protein [Polyangiaceae bacterium]